MSVFRTRAAVVARLTSLRATLMRAAATIALCACPAIEARASEWMPHVTAQVTAVKPTRSDTTVRLANAPMYPRGADVRVELTIGQSAGRDEYMLGAISDLSIDGRGAMYVVDRSVPAIRMYDRSGRFVRNVGRRGQGPGEFLSPVAAELTKDGRLLVWDVGNSRVNVYGQDGSVLGHWRVPGGSEGGATAGAAGTQLMMVDTAGFVYLRWLVLDLDNPQMGPRRVWYRLNPEGEVRDTLYPPDVPGEFRTLDAYTPDGRRMASAPLPFAPRAITAFSPLGYFVTGVNNRYAFEFLTSAGVVSVRRNVTPQPLPPNVANAARAEVTRRMQTVDPGWRWNGPPIPLVREPYASLELASDGRVWVLLERPFDDIGANAASSGGGGGRSGEPARAVGGACPSIPARRYDLFEPDGRYLGELTVPRDIALLRRRGDELWARSCNGDGAPLVIRLRITWRPAQ